MWEEIVTFKENSGEKLGENLCMRNSSERLLEKENVHQQNQSLWEFMQDIFRNL